MFIERASESIRVKGEFVPIGYVEQRFASVDTLHDVAVWRRSSDLVDDEIVLYVVGDAIPHRGDLGGERRTPRVSCGPQPRPGWPRSPATPE